MHPGLHTMRSCRRQATHIKQTVAAKGHIVYTLDNDSIIICFTQSIKKSEVVSMIESYTEGTVTMITGPGISRPAHALAVQHSIEFVSDDLYAFDRMQSNLLPTYTIMTPDDICSMEIKHKCTRSNWPTLPSTDPVALYLGLTHGMCLFVYDRSGVSNVRHVVGGNSSL